MRDLREAIAREEAQLAELSHKHNESEKRLAALKAELAAMESTPVAAFAPVLPEKPYRTQLRSEHLFDTQAFDALLKLAAINTVAIPKELLRWRIPRKSLTDLLSGPLNGGMLRDMEVHHPATVVGKNHQNEQHSESHCRHHKEIDRY